MKNNPKNKLLWKGILFDLIGMATMLVPAVGPFLDVVWAPVAGQQMRKMYPNQQGKIAAVIVFVEEILPYTDVVPTFTLMWLYTYVLTSSKNYPPIDDDGATIEVEATDV